MNISAYPLCAKRLHFQRANLSEDGFNEYWAAVNVADECVDSELERFGGIDFSDHSPENGARLLSRLEAFLSQKRTARRPTKDDGEAFTVSSVKAFLGANGVKVSKVEGGVSGYWTVAEILWPDHIKAEDKQGAREDVFTLRFQLTRIPKKKRGKIAKSNLERLPAQVRAWS